MANSWLTTFNTPPESLNAGSERVISLSEMIPDLNCKHPSEVMDENVLRDRIAPKIEAFIKRKRGRYRNPKKIIKLFRLRYLEDKNFDEIAKKLGKNESHQNIQSLLKKLFRDIRNNPALVRLLDEIR